MYLYIDMRVEGSILGLEQLMRCLLFKIVDFLDLIVVFT